MNQISYFLFGCVVASALVFATGCSVECGPGTFEQDGECVSGESVPCGPGTEILDGTCRPSGGGGGGECGPGTRIEGGVCVPTLAAQGNAIRMLAPTVSIPVQLAAVANPVLLDSFSSGESQNFLAIYQPSDGTFRLYGGTGVAETDGTYTLDLTQSYEVDATPGFMSDPYTLELDALGGNPIVLEDTVVSGTIAEVGGVQLITGGSVTGILTPANASNVFIDLAAQTLEELLNSLGDAPDVDFDMMGGAESWTFTFTFEAQPIWMF